MKLRRADGFRGFLGIVLGVLLIGYSSPTPAKSPTGTLSSQAEGTVNSGQQLPISAQVIVAGHTIGLEVARTPQQQALGLMYRTTLADNRGMLFPFEPPQPVRFWMKNTLIPLDMVFLRDGVVKAIAPNAPPCTTDPCSTYGPGIPVNQVIELRSGRAAELGLKVGQLVKLQFLDSKR
jgi:uncharacterized membrane protein (UPF0127 family)